MDYDLFSSVFAWIRYSVFLVLPLVVALRFHRLWRETGDRGYIWLLAALGVIPIVSTTGTLLWQLLGASAVPQPGTAAFPMALVFQFFGLTVACASIGCMFMALGELGNGRVTFRGLFSSGDRNSTGEDS